MTMQKTWWLPVALVNILYLMVHSDLAVADNSASLSLYDARHLITRTGFGASPNELNQLIGKSRVEAVTSIVTGLNGGTHTNPPDWINNSAPHHFRFANLPTPERQQFRQARLNEVQSLRRWWVNEMVSTTNPQKERLLLFWHNHFATAYSALDNQAISIARQHMMLRENVAGNFRVMLQNIIRDPAMLNYLDNNNSKKQKPNENLARELMELFSLGEGNYTEQDIKNAARALTGYSLSSTYDMRFVFHPWNHDKTQKTLFGNTGKFDGDDLVDLILEQPAAARFITAKLWRMLISDIEQNDTRLTAHANAFRNSEYDIKTLYKSLLLSDAFWDKDNRATLVKSPVSLVVGTIRSTGILPTDWQTLPSRLQQMGQHLFEPPNVAGWPGGATWITPGRLLTRLDWLEQQNARANNEAQLAGMGTASTLITMADQTLPDTTMQSTDSANMATTGMANTMSGKYQLAIKMAAEEFDEHVQYRVKVHGQNNAVWDSGVLELAGGHDTKRMGRISQRLLPWQTINFPIPIAADDISAIEVSFINDGVTPDGADRNLYVSRARLDNRVWLASDGKQTGKCPRKNPDQQGSIYCPGTLKMVKSQNVTTAPTDAPEANTMRASSINLNFVRPSKRKPTTEMVFTLSDVEFEGRFWDSLSIFYTKHKTGHAVRLNTTGCWPNCVIEWPECAKTSKHGVTTLSVELEKDEKHCMYNGLKEADQKLARALWMILDDLYVLGNDDQKMQRPNLARNYNQWRSIVTDMQSELPASVFFDSKIKLDVVPRPIIDVTANESVVKPLPAGRTSEQRDSDLKRLAERNPDSYLGTLPVNSVGGNSGHNNTLQNVLTDLSFQLQ